VDPSLHDAREKLRRSRQHLDELIDDYCRLFGLKRVNQNFALPWRNATTVNRVVHDDEGRWVVFGQDVPELPDDWGLILGDALHNARSALDVLVCQLVVLNSKRPQRGNAFPIYTQAPQGQWQRQRFKECLKGLKAEHARGVRDLQPYKHPGTRESWLLTTLAVLDNLDKHQLVHPVFSRETRDQIQKVGLLGNIQLTPPGPYKIRIPEAQTEISGGFLELLRVLTPLGTRIAVTWPSSIAVGWGLADVTLADLVDIHAYIVGIVESFSPDFP
jgi:hypothetical protein